MKKSMIVRIVTMVGLLLTVVVILAFLTWKDISAGLPSFDKLQLVTVNSFRADFGRASIEFFDAQGHRFQTSRISNDEMNRIKNALGRRVPVYIRYGRWQSLFPSNKIFTVHQLEIEDSVVIPYERLVLAKQKEQDHKFLIILGSVIISIGAIIFGVRLGLRPLRAPVADITTER